MIICPTCGNYMVYREGTSEYGHYEFYGCSTYPACTAKVKIEDAYKYDDGKKMVRPELSREEEAEELRDILLKEGWEWGDATYAKHMWEKD